jgi:hypothetical protein
MTTYTLPPIQTVHGIVAMSINSSVAGLSAPTGQVLTSLGTLTMAAVVNLQNQELATLAVQLRETDDGFFHSILQATTFDDSGHTIYDSPVFLFTLDEGSGAKFLFAGIPDRTTFIERAHYVSGTDRVRMMDLTLVSAVKKIFDLKTSDWMSEVNANSLTTNATEMNAPYKVMSVRGLFSAMLSKSGLNPTYNRDDTVFVYGTQDITFKSGAGNYHVGQLYVATKFVSQDIPFVVAYTDFFYPDGVAALHTYYYTIKAMLGDLTRNFCVKLFFSYDPVTQRYKFELRQNWRTYTSLLSFGSRLKGEEFGSDADSLITGARASQLAGTQTFFWFSSEHYPGIGGSQAEPPSYVTLDFDTRNVFNIIPNPATGGDGRVLYASASEIIEGGAAPAIVDDCTYYDYWANVVSATSSTNERLENAVAGYHFNHMHFEWKKCIATYAKIVASEGGGDTFEVVQPQKRTTLNDGLGARNYWCNRVEIDLNAAELKIEWIQETIN